MVGTWFAATSDFASRLLLQLVWPPVLSYKCQLLVFRMGFASTRNERWQRVRISIFAAVPSVEPDWHMVETIPALLGKDPDGIVHIACIFVAVQAGERFEQLRIQLRM